MKIEYWVIIAILVFIVIVIFTFNSLNKDGVKCVSNPFVYGIEQLEKESGKNMICGCSAKGFNPIYFTSNGSVRN